MTSKSDARCAAAHVLIISDIHGCLEAFLQPLIQSGIVYVTKNTTRQHIQWVPKCDTCVLIVGDITDCSENTAGEMKDEELLIITHIHHLNRSHALYHNPITVLLGNHCYNNLIGYRPKHVSARCVQHMQDIYLEGLLQSLLPGSPMTGPKHLSQRAMPLCRRQSTARTICKA